MATRRVALATAAAAALLLGTLAPGAGAAPIPFDHYFCYKASGATNVPPPVTLTDQFDEAEGTQEHVTPKALKQLCNPVIEKNHEKVLFDPVIHLTKHPFKAQPRVETVEIENQFEKATVTTLAAVELMVPTTKGLVPPPPPTGAEYSFEHYKCYTLQAAPFVKRSVLVTDQFGEHQAHIVARARLCNPVTKITSTATFPIRRPERHLVCYTVEGKPETLPAVFTNNQFGIEHLTLTPAAELCLPSIKRVIPPPRPFDHYICYKASGATHVPPPVTLIDQFDEKEGTRENVKPRVPKQLCNPVIEKNHEKVLFDPVIHLTKHPFTAQPRVKTVEIENQFEVATITTVAAVELMVPTTKGLTEPPAPPTGEEHSFEHYKCYTLQKAPFLKRSVLITDQFGEHKVHLVARSRLCNPVTKITSTHTFPIRNPERHLVCYTIEGKPETPPTVFTNNQFGTEQLTLTPATELCLPSLKRLTHTAARRLSS